MELERLVPWLEGEIGHEHRYHFFSLALAIVTLAAWGAAWGAAECARGSLAAGSALPSLTSPASTDPGGKLGEAREALAAGRFAAARNALRVALALESLTPSERSQAFSLSAIAYAGDGDFDAARAAARSALDTRGALPLDDAQAALNAAIALAEIDDVPAALDALRGAIEGAGIARDTALLARARALVAVLDARAGNAAAASAAREARAAALALPEDALRAGLLVAVGEALVGEKRGAATDSAAHALLTSAYDSASHGSRAAAAAQALGLIGVLQASAGAREPAARTLARALALSLAAGDDPWTFRWQWMLGRVQRASGDLNAARASFTRAAERLEDAKSRYALGGAGRSRLAWRGVYVDLADTLLDDATRATTAAQRAKALDAARAALELSRTAEVEDFFNDPCIASRIVRRVSPEDADPSAAILYPVLLEDRIELIVGHRSGLAQFTSPGSRDKVDAAAQRLRVLLEKRTTRQYLRPAQELYDLLVRPAAAHLARLGVTTLVIVPDGVLRTVPFAALHDGDKFLVERYALGVTPVASLVEARHLAPARIRALLSGLSEPSQGFAALPAVREELALLAPLLAAPVFRDSDFSSATLEDALSRAPINLLHIASHGQFSRNPTDTFVLTFDGHLTLAQLRQAISAGKLREEPLELLTLSACQTAAGDERAALGLAGVALGAGARSALASLWAVNDESTSLLITGFYENLVRRGLTKAGALRDAQVALLHDERFAHPAYWAPFLVIGNWL